MVYPTRNLTVFYPCAAIEQTAVLCIFLFHDIVSDTESQKRVEFSLQLRPIDYETLKMRKTFPGAIETA